MDPAVQGFCDSWIGWFGDSGVRGFMDPWIQGLGGSGIHGLRMGFIDSRVH